VAVRREEHFIDGKKVYGWDIFNGPHAVAGNDVYAPVRAAIGG
jgi:phage tail tube protein FII